MCASLSSCCPLTSCWPQGGAPARVKLWAFPFLFRCRGIGLTIKTTNHRDGKTDLVIINTIALIIMPLWISSRCVQRLTWVWSRYISPFDPWFNASLSLCARLARITICSGTRLGDPACKAAWPVPPFRFYDGDGGARVAALSGDEARRRR